jgi:hypothetical protein
MNNGHLTDEMIQEFIWDSERLNESATAHMLACDHCQTRAENYQLLFTEMEELPKAVFNFDLSSLVLDQIATQSLAARLNGNNQMDSKPITENAPAVVKQYAPKTKAIWPGMIIALMATGLIGTPVYLFQDYFQDMIAEVSIMGTYLIIITVVLIAVLLIVDEYRKYNHQINSLDI